MKTARPGYTRCFYQHALVPLGRARTRCPACGAVLQDRQPEDPHYRPKMARDRHLSSCVMDRSATPVQGADDDTHLPALLGEPEPLI